MRRALVAVLSVATGWAGAIHAQSASVLPPAAQPMDVLDLGESPQHAASRMPPPPKAGAADTSRRGGAGEATPERSDAADDLLRDRGFGAASSSPAGLQAQPTLFDSLFGAESGGHGHGKDNKDGDKEKAPAPPPPDQGGGDKKH